MKKAVGSLLAIFSVLTALLIGGTSAQATTPTSNCSNGQWGVIPVQVSAVICKIDVNDNSVLEDVLDLKIVALNAVASGNQLNLLADALDDLTINIEDIDVDSIEEVLRRILIFLISLILPCGCH